MKECEQVGHKINTLQSDNGGEIDDVQTKSLRNKYFIQQLLTMPYWSELNGFIERQPYYV